MQSGGACTLLKFILINMGDSFEAFVDSETVKFIGNQKIVQSGLGIYDEAHKSDKFLVKSAVKMTDLTLAW